MRRVSLAGSLLALLVAALTLAGCVPSGTVTPTAAPVTTPAPAPAPAPSGTADVPFSAASPWNTPLATGTPWRDEPRLRAEHWWVNYESYSIPVVRGSAGDPLVAVSVPASWGWPAGTLTLHVPVGVTGATGTDGALAVVSDGVAYDFWQFQRADATHASAAAYAEASTATGTGFGTAHPFLGAGIRAAGSSTLAGLLTGTDVTGPAEIRHALAVSLLGSELRSDFVPPAIANEGPGDTGTIPMGSRLGIPAGTPMPTGLSPLGQRIWRALVTYGAFVVDQHGGSSPVILYADPLSVPAGSIGPVREFWNGVPSDLDRIMPFVRVVS